MTRRFLLTITLLGCLSLHASAQFAKIAKWCGDNNVANNLDVAITAGTDGRGLEASTPVTRWASLRAGVQWLPSFHMPMHFDITTFSGGLEGNNISHVQQMLYDMTGLEMDDKVKMIAKPTVVNFKLLVDVYPFQNNRHWHFTAGFFMGNRTIAKAVNAKEEMPTLVALNIYNRGYEYFTNIEDVTDVNIGGSNYIDPDKVEEIQAKFHEYGHIGIHIGDFKDGKPYYMEPDTDGSVSAKAYTNRFKPYLGFGYSGAIDKEKRWNVGVEAGALFWGGAPDVINHDGVNMTKDLDNIRGRVGDYMKIVKALPVYPVIDFKINYTFF